MAEEKLQINNTAIPLIYEHNSQLPLFYIQLVFKGAGSMSDGAHLGLSEIVSSLLNEGTKKLGATKFAEKLEEKAISLSAESDSESLRISLTGMKAVQKESLSLLKDLLIDPNFTPQALKKVKEDAIVSLSEKEDDYDYQANRLLKSMLFQGTALEFPSSGTPQTIEKISLKDAQQFYNTHINLNSLSVVAGGSISLSEISKDLSTALQNLPKGKSPSLTKITARDSAQNQRILKETQQAYIYFGAPFNVANLQKELAKIRVASFVLGGSGFGSRMMEEIRVKRGLAYSAVMRLNASKNISFAFGYLQTSLKNEKDAQKLVSKVVNDFVKNGITKQELQEAQRYLLGSEPLRNETLEQRLSTAAANFHNDLPRDFNEQLLKEIANLELEEVNTYIKAHTEIQNLTFAIVSADTKP